MIALPIFLIVIALAILGLATYRGGELLNRPVNPALVGKLVLYGGLLLVVLVLGFSVSLYWSQS